MARLSNCAGRDRTRVSQSLTGRPFRQLAERYCHPLTENSRPKGGDASGPKVEGHRKANAGAFMVMPGTSRSEVGVIPEDWASNIESIATVTTGAKEHAGRN